MNTTYLLTKTDIRSLTRHVLHNYQPLSSSEDGHILTPNSPLSDAPFLKNRDELQEQIRESMLASKEGYILLRQDATVAANSYDSDVFWGVQDRTAERVVGKNVENYVVKDAFVLQVISAPDYTTSRMYSLSKLLDGQQQSVKRGGKRLIFDDGASTSYVIDGNNDCVIKRLLDNKEVGFVTLHKDGFDGELNLRDPMTRNTTHKALVEIVSVFDGNNNFPFRANF